MQKVSIQITEDQKKWLRANWPGLTQSQALRLVLERAIFLKTVPCNKAVAK